MAQVGRGPAGSRPALLALVAAAMIGASAPADLASSREPGHRGHARGHRLAKQECKGDRREEPGEFAAEYGGLGAKALKRCIADEERDHDW